MRSAYPAHTLHRLGHQNLTLLRCDVCRAPQVRTCASDGVPLPRACTARSLVAICKVLSDNCLVVQREQRTRRAKRFLVITSQEKVQERCTLTQGST